MADWAVVVYGRTYEVDFRLLAIPHDLTHSEAFWISQRIQVMTRSAENLPNAPRWGIFSQDGLCVVGISCMVQELLTAAEEEFTSDCLGRPLFAFVGYVGRITQTVSEIPDYLDQDLRSFRSPYLEYALPNWTAKSFENRSRTPTMTEYRSLHHLPVNVSNITNQAELALSLPDKRQIFLYPDTQQNRQSLWRMAAMMLCAGQPVSLCLGLSRISDANDGLFLNATVVGATERRVLSNVNIPQVSPPVAAPSPVRSSEPQRSAISGFPDRNQHRIILLGVMELLIGALLGVLIGLILAQGLRLNLIKSTVIGAFGGVGFIFLLQSLQRWRMKDHPRSSQGIFLPLLEQLRRRSKSPETPPSEVKSPDPMYGFKEKVHQEEGNDGFREWR
jgi:hypothetical protein